MTALQHRTRHCELILRHCELILRHCERSEAISISQNLTALPSKGGKLCHEQSGADYVQAQFPTFVGGRGWFYNYLGNAIQLIIRNYLPKTLAFFLLIYPAINVYAEEMAVRYSTAYFGPNANPVPPFADATIPQYTTLTLSANYFGGFDGDLTYNGHFAVEVPLFVRRVSLKVWTPFLEYFEVPQEVFIKRDMIGKRTGMAGIGDIYVQTRINILTEKTYLPAIVLNITLKTASTTSNEFAVRRYFDTPGYYFDVELGKSLHFNNTLLRELRLVADVGFLCWETTESTQNDAKMYGIKLIATNRFAKLEASLSGYKGWMNNGDMPLVFTSKLIFMASMPLTYFVEYQYGINDFPYRHVQVGAQFSIAFLTPRYK
jgi:hypothetical protein